MSSRLNVNINERTQSELQELRTTTGRSFTQIVYRAITLYALLEQERRAGREIHFVDPNDSHNTTRLEVL